MRNEGRHIDGTAQRALTEDEVWWAIKKITEGYKTSWISDALRTNTRTLQRNISYYTWFANLGEIIEYYGREPLEYDGGRQCTNRSSGANT